MHTSTMQTLNIRDDDELNFMIFGFGYFLVRLLSREKIKESDCNAIVDDINAAGSAEEILAATVGRENSLWRKICIDDLDDLILLDTNWEVTERYQRFYVSDFNTKGVLLRDENIFAHVMHYLCYGRKGLLPAFRSEYDRYAENSNEKIGLLVCACWSSKCDAVSLPAIVLPIYKFPNCNATLDLAQVAINSSKLANIEYLCILDRFITPEQKQQIEQSNEQQKEQLTLTKDKKTIFIFAFTVLIIFGFLIIAAANIISWANLIKIALLSSIAAKAGIAAAGIILGGVLLICAYVLGYKKHIISEHKLHCCCVARKQKNLDEPETRNDLLLVE